MINDLSRPVRVAMAAQLLGLGLILAAPASTGSSPDLSLAVFGVGAAVSLCGAVCFSWWTRRADRRIRDDVRSGSPELVRTPVDGRRPPASVPGRVVRHRSARGLPGFAAASPEAVAGEARIVVVTALTAAGARRVVALVPRGVLSLSTGSPVRVLLHPERPDVAVLDTAAAAHQLQAGEADPRWRTAAVPTERSVLGGYLPLAVSGAIGLGAGFGLAGIVGLVAETW